MELATLALTEDEHTVCPLPKDIPDESMGYLPRRCVSCFILPQHVSSESVAD